LTAGCSQFKSSKRIDLAPFAENMITLAADIEYGLGEQQAVLIRDFLDGPKVQRLDVYGPKVRKILRGTISYSMELVTLADSRISDQERAEALADYLDGLLRPVLEAPVPPLNLTIAQLDTIVADVRSQKNLLDGLNSAQRIIDEFARASAETIAEANDALEEAIQEIRDRLYDDNKEIIFAYRELRNRQVGTILNVRYLAEYRRGDPSALDSLLVHEPHLKGIVTSVDGVTEEDIRDVERRLLFKLNSLSELRKQLEPDLELYWRQQRELDNLAKVYTGALRKARVSVIAFARGHQRLAAGIVDPAKIDLLGIARRTAGSAVPLP